MLATRWKLSLLALATYLFSSNQFVVEYLGVDPNPCYDSALFANLAEFYSLNVFSNRTDD